MHINFFMVLLLVSLLFISALLCRIFVLSLNKVEFDLANVLMNYDYVCFNYT